MLDGGSLLILYWNFRLCQPCTPRSRPGQFHPEPAPLTQSGFHPHFAAHPGNSSLDDGQTDPSSGIVVAQAFEDSEDALMVLWGDSNPIVFHPEANEIAGLL